MSSGRRRSAAAAPSAAVAGAAANTRGTLLAGGGARGTGGSPSARLLGITFVPNPPAANLMACYPNCWDGSRWLLVSRMCICRARRAMVAAGVATANTEKRALLPPHSCAGSRVQGQQPHLHPCRHDSPAGTGGLGSSPGMQSCTKMSVRQPWAVHVACT